MVSNKKVKVTIQYALVGISFFILILSSFLVNSFLRTSPEQNYRPVNAATIPTPTSVTPTPPLSPLPNN